MKQHLTLFMWGYYGWGNHTTELKKAVDAVERARGFNPPMFVDIRIRRQVRAQGFLGNAFEGVVGKNGYRWMKELGNESILTGEQSIVIRNPEAANDLLDLATDLATEKRRVIFFCSCQFPSNCHRNTVRDLLLKYSREREQPVEVVEWPGGDAQIIDICVSSKEFRKLRSGQKAIPLPHPTPLEQFAGLPWGSVAKVYTAENEALFVITGPVRCRNSDTWYLPVLEPTTQETTRADAERYRNQFGYQALAG